MIVLAEQTGAHPEGYFGGQESQTRALQRQVDNAYAYRRPESVLNRATYLTSERLAKLRWQRQLFQGPSHTLIFLGPFRSPPNVAAVTDPNDYEQLLRLADEKIRSDGFAPTKSSEEWITENKTHELEHFYAGAGVEGLELHLAVEFLGDDENVLLRPQTVMSGRVTIGNVQRILHAVSSPSPSDRLLHTA